MNDAHASLARLAVAPCRCAVAMVGTAQPHKAAPKRLVVVITGQPIARAGFVANSGIHAPSGGVSSARLRLTGEVVVPAINRSGPHFDVRIMRIM